MDLYQVTLFYRRFLSLHQNILMKYRHLFLFAIVIVLSACSSKYYYSKGLAHAQHPTTESICNSLTVVDSKNTKLQWKTINGQSYVLAVTWKADTTYYTRQDHYSSTTGLYSYNTGNYPVFITVAPYLKEKQYGKLSGNKLTLRLDELLGLPPTAHYSYFLEVWVKPEDIFRPCFDPSVDATTCEFTPSKEDAARGDHMAWMYKYIYNSYADTNIMNRYPFSHLGYTYDWCPKNKAHTGLSEFVIGNNKDIYIGKVYTTKGYFQQ